MVCSFYYSVVVSWTAYYFIMMSALPELPKDEATSQAIFDHFTTETYWPVLCHATIMLLVFLCILGGLKWAEIANMVLVPLLLLIILFTFSWSLTRPFGEVGIKFLFSPSWDSFADPTLWISALSQNAFDTGAGTGCFVAYASYFSRNDVSVRYALIIPLVNNLVSIICGITIFGTVFSTMLLKNPTLTRNSIIGMMKMSGPGGTGLTFTWIPVLFASVGIMGRILCSLFFLCLCFAGFTSLISGVQLFALCIKNTGVSHRISLAISVILHFLCGLPSALWINFLTNQDTTWSFALIISGAIFTLLVVVYGVERYRKVVVNDFGIGDWKLRIPWSFIIAVCVPLEAAFLIVWWIYAEIKSDPEWYIPTLYSLSTVLIEWSLLVITLAIATVVCWKKQPKFLDYAKECGYDPVNPDYPSKEQIKMNEFATTREIAIPPAREPDFFSASNPNWQINDKDQFHTYL
ncbi:hypothetical protein Ciccas_008564 [Cichlidogyrus casuarinus]|uniref:Uncharacterized protein n=1 Tax=Cichlidogyrus casuarinus TaxID=1844966 RepID=A0ABD2Q145_9PLAT